MKVLLVGLNQHSKLLVSYSNPNPHEYRTSFQNIDKVGKDLHWEITSGKSRKKNKKERKMLWNFKINVQIWFLGNIYANNNTFFIVNQIAQKGQHIQNKCIFVISKWHKSASIQYINAVSYTLWSKKHKLFSLIFHHFTKLNSPKIIYFLS